MGTRRGLGSVYPRGKTWWIKYYRSGLPIRESSKSDNRQDAVDLLAQRQTEKRQMARRRGVFVSELLDDVLAYYRIHNPKSVKDFAEPFIDGANGLRKYFGNLKADQVTTDRLQKFQAHLKNIGQSNATVNRKMALLRKAFREAARSTPVKVAVPPSFPKKLRENNVRTGFLDPADYRNLLDHLPAELRPLLVIGYHTGCRVSELLALRRSQVDLKAGEIRLRAGETKNEEGRVLPIYGDMGEFIAEQDERTKATAPRCKWMFHRDGKQIKDFRKSWETATAAAGMPDLLFHDLRRSAVRNMIRAGIPERVAMEISGHKTRAVFDRYNIVDRKDLDDAGKKLAAYLSDSKAKEGRK